MVRTRTIHAGDWVLVTIDDNDPGEILKVVSINGADVYVCNPRGPDPDEWHRVHFTRCVLCDEPRDSLADKERRVREAQPWYRRRDANLRDVFHAPIIKRWRT